MGNEILQKLWVVRKEMGIREDERKMGGFVCFVRIESATPNNGGTAVHRGKGITHKTLETMCNASAWLQQCWKSCAYGFKIFALRFGDHETKEMLGVASSKV